MPLLEKAIELALLLCVSATLQSCGQRRQPPTGYDEALQFLVSQYPAPVSISPDEHYELLKTKGESQFTIEVLDVDTDTVIGKLTSPDSQLSLTWRPKAPEVYYVADNGGDRNYSLYCWRFLRSSAELVVTPPIHTAEPPLRWSPDGRYLALYVGHDNDGRIVAIDMESVRKPICITIGSASSDRDFQVNPSGSKLAWVDKLNSSRVDLAALRGSSGTEPTQQLDLPGQVKHLAWDGEHSLLCTVREPADRFFSLDEISTVGRHITRLAAPSGDVENPRVLANRIIAFEVNQRGLNRVILREPSTGRQREIAAAAGASIVSVSSDGSKLACLCTPTTDTPRLELFNAELHPIDTAQPFSTQTKPIQIGPRPTEIEPLNERGPGVHAFLWDAGPNTIVYIHGGPHLQERPSWDSRRQYLLDQGISYVVVNYRGSTGYGQDYEREEDVANQAEDVAAVVRWLESYKAVPPARITLMGESSGTRIAVKAAKICPVGGLVLVSTVPLGGSWTSDAPLPSRLLCFQGENDPICSPDIARRELETTFGKGLMSGDCSNLIVFPEEGHQFRSSGAWARVLAEIVSTKP